MKDIDACIRLAYKSLESRDYRMTFRVLDELLRSAPLQPTILERLCILNIPWLHEYVQKKMVPGGAATASELVVAAVAAGMKGWHHTSLALWDNGTSKPDPLLSSTELLAAKARYLGTLESLLQGGGVKQAIIKQLAKRYGCLSDVEVLVKRVAAEKGLLWSSVCHDVVSRTKPMPKSHLSRSRNEVFVMDGVMLPFSLVFKCGQDKEQLEREYHVTCLLSSLLPTNVVPRCLGFNLGVPPILITERAKGRTLEQFLLQGDMDKGMLTRVLDAIKQYVSVGEAHSLQLKGLGVPTYDVCNRAEKTLYELVPEYISDVLGQHIRFMRYGNRESSFCHGDMHPGQLLLLPDSSITVLDWEWACFGDLGRDMVRLSCFLESEIDMQTCATFVNQWRTSKFSKDYDDMALLEHLLLIRSFSGKSGMAPCPEKLRRQVDHLIQVFGRLCNIDNIQGRTEPDNEYGRLFHYLQRLGTGAAPKNDA